MERKMSFHTFQGQAKTKNQSGIKTPSKFLALDFLMELQSNNYISTGGIEYSAVEVDLLVAEKSNADMEGFYEDQMDLWEACAEAEAVEVPVPAAAPVRATISFVLNVVSPALCRFFTLSQGFAMQLMKLGYGNGTQIVRITGEKGKNFLIDRFYLDHGWKSSKIAKDDRRIYRDPELTQAALANDLHGRMIGYLDRIIGLLSRGDLADAWRSDLLAERDQLMADLVELQGVGK
jgi:hypothetical protein